MTRAPVLVGLLLLFGLPALGQEAHSPLLEEIKNGKEIRVRVRNRNFAPITIRVSAQLSGARAIKSPVVVVCPADSKVDAMFIRTGERPWKSKYQYQWTLGDHRVQHRYRAYRLPFAKDSAFEVIQGYDGKISHTGKDRYSLDFKMPEGTAVLAARPGLVVSSKANSNQGGPSPDFADQANFVSVLHQDGTLAGYYHLKRGGVRVKPGQRVRAGQLLGYSGNTGYSSGPHLHFMVYRAGENAQSRETLPVQFLVEDASGPQTLRENHLYRSPE